MAKSLTRSLDALLMRAFAPVAPAAASALRDQYDRDAADSEKGNQAENARSALMGVWLLLAVVVLLLGVGLKEVAPKESALAVAMVCSFAFAPLAAMGLLHGIVEGIYRRRDGRRKFAAVESNATVLLLCALSLFVAFLILL